MRDQRELLGSRVSRDRKVFKVFKASQVMMVLLDLQVQTDQRAQQELLVLREPLAQLELERLGLLGLLGLPD